MSDYNKKWAYVLELLEPEVNEVTFETWFEPLKFSYIDENAGILYILCDTEFAISTINNRYMHLLEGYTEAVFKNKYKIKLLLEGSVQENKKETPKNSFSTTSTVNEEFDKELISNPKYTFDNFVVGSNNEYAHAAALAVAENPAKNFNPLYLYSESGLGKTHLMYAICNHVMEHYKDKKVLYVTSEMFTNEIISAIKTEKTKEFRDKYRQNITTSNKAKQTMVDAHIVEMTGGNGAYRGAISIASNLPNGDKLAIQTGGGFRNVYNKELRIAKYADGAEKKLNAILNEAYHKYFNTEALHDFTILHENLHSLGPKEGLQMLGVYKNTIEEFKADVGSFVMLDELTKVGFYTKEKQKEIITSDLFGYTPLNADINNAHITKDVMKHNYFIQNGAIEFDKSGKMKINFEKVTECAREMLKDAIEIQLSKSEKAAKTYINKYASWTNDLDMLANKLKAVDTRLNSYLHSPIAKLL